MNTVVRKRLWAVALAGMLGLSLVACAPPAAEVSEKQGADEVDTSEAPSAIDPATCLHGTWKADNAFMLGAMQEFGDEIVSVEGEVFVTFDAAGTTATEYRQWLITAEVEGTTTTILRDGIDTGIYTSSEHTVSIADTAVGSKITVSMGGSDMTIDPEPIDYADAAYTCDASLATITTPDGELELTRS